MRTRLTLAALCVPLIAGCDDRKAAQPAAAPAPAGTSDGATAAPAEPPAAGAGAAPSNGFIACPGDPRCPR
jgi:hypothetical protein